jgi:voltage-gated potassium channel
LAATTSHSIKHLRTAALLLGGIIIAGIAGYMLIEGWSFLDATYMTVITIATVGFREVHALSPAGQVFTICLIASGVSAAAYTIGRFLEFILEGYFSEVMGGRSMKKRIDQLKNHYIICGFGRVGEQVAREFKRSGAPFVVLDPNPDVKKYLEAEDVLYIQGDAADEEVLRQAGIDKAKGLVSVVDSDADNVYVTLTARALNQKLFIIARSNLESAAYKLKRAGANRVISPYSLGGRRIASMVLKPFVSDFLDTVMHGEKMEFQLEEMTVGKDSPLRDSSVRDADIRRKSGAMVLSIYRAGGGFESDLHGDTKIGEGDRLIVIGTPDQLEKLETMNKNAV